MMSRIKVPWYNLGLQIVRVRRAVVVGHYGHSDRTVVQVIKMDVWTFLLGLVNPIYVPFFFFFLEPLSNMDWRPYHGCRYLPS